ncbi:hypothetical protein [Streptomyces sp. NP-1717]|uniref:hypothetical protein n=1 Tax=Streptomyces sp. NP-1717 TaxID=2704470 RepID=UPI001F5DB012|nr:hypothetical protein [Streptomyces sp. NP-1717]MCI3224720.1 hypothetical protein [Streptomyces sp. NP-1717]
MSPLPQTPRAAAAALLTAGLLAVGTTAAVAAPAPAAAERITSAAELQEHLAQAVALEAAQGAVALNGDPVGRPALQSKPGTAATAAC